jgi:hypothetical protein
MAQSGIKLAHWLLEFGEGRRLIGLTVLTTPVRRAEFLLGKALAALLPSIVVAYGVRPGSGLRRAVRTPRQ